MSNGESKPQEGASPRPLVEMDESELAERFFRKDLRVGDRVRARVCGDCGGSGKCDCCRWRMWGLRFWMWGKCPICEGSGTEGPSEVVYVRPD